MKGFFLCLALGLVPSALAAQTQSEAPGISLSERNTPLRDQDINPNTRLLEALERAATKGPVFRISPERIALSGIPGETLTETVRITNVGDQDGEIRGVNTLGRFEDIGLTTDCGGVLELGAFCEFTVSYTGTEPVSLRTAIAGTIDQRDRPSFEVPVAITIERPAPRTEPASGPEAPAAPRSRARDPRDIAAAYMTGAAPRASVRRGFTVLRPAPEPSDAFFKGVQFSDIEVEDRTTDPRFPREDVASVDASLPVDRDRILTTDRVIKAILETPVSNVMCSKVVATIESDVYSATSQRPLIPAGSRAVGECGEFAGERAAVAWERIITTDGRNISFDIGANTNAADGRGGATGRIYLSRFDRYVLPIFSTMVDTASGVVTAIFGENETVVVDENGNRIQDNSARNEGIRIVTEGVRGTTQELINEIRDVREVAVVPAGSRIDIEINEDIYFKDSRRIVRVADLEFDLDPAPARSAERSDPDSLRLVPVGPQFDGPAVEVDGRRYRLENRVRVIEDGQERFEFRRPQGDAAAADDAGAEAPAETAGMEANAGQ